MKYTKRGKPLTKPCVVCNDIITRPYKMTLKNWEITKYCSQKCNGISRTGKPSPAKPRIWTEQERIEVGKRSRGNQYAKGYKHTDEAKRKMSINRSGSNHWDWREDRATYSAFHKWLVKNFGVATYCENKYCLGESKTFHYALIKGKNHSHNKENYAMLCASCHKFYDVGWRLRVEL